MKCDRLTPSVHVHCTVGVDIKVLSAQSSKCLLGNKANNFYFWEIGVSLNLPV